MLPQNLPRLYSEHSLQLIYLNRKAPKAKTHHRLPSGAAPSSESSSANRPRRVSHRRVISGAFLPPLRIPVSYGYLYASSKLHSTEHRCARRQRAGPRKTVLHSSRFLQIVGISLSAGDKWSKMYSLCSLTTSDAAAEGKQAQELPCLKANSIFTSDRKESIHRKQS